MITLHLPPITPRLRQNFTWRYYYSGEFPFAKSSVQHVRHRRIGAAEGLLRALPSPELMVDIGCGPGDSTLCLACALGARGVVGVDISRDCCWFARTFAEANDIPARFVTGSGTGLPVRTVSADRVVSFEMIDHLPNWIAFFQEAGRILRPGGHLLITTPNVFGFHGLLKAVYRRARGLNRLSAAWRKDGDFYEEFLSGRQIERGLAQSGLTSLACQYVAFVLTAQPDWVLPIVRAVEPGSNVFRVFAAWL